MTLPRIFRQRRLLIVGCGDVGQRVLPQVLTHWRVTALSTQPEKLAAWREQGLRVLQGNLDDAASLQRLAGLANAVLHLAPPPNSGRKDTRTQHLLQAMRLRTLPSQMVYASTSGVYGDCAGEWVAESRPANPQTPRAQRRVDAESQLRRFGANQYSQSRCTISVLRIPGIYAPDRPNGTPQERLRKGLPVLTTQDDVYTNHIHADDLARSCCLALFRGKAQRTYNVSDDSDMKMGDYYCAAAQLYALPAPVRLPKAEIAAHLSPMTLSFMGESRRLRNQRMKTELRLQLRWPNVLDGLRSGV